MKCIFAVHDESSLRRGGSVNWEMKYETAMWESTNGVELAVKSKRRIQRQSKSRELDVAVTVKPIEVDLLEWFWDESYNLLGQKNMIDREIR